MCYGKPVARIVPLRASRLDEMRAAGLVRRATRRPTDLALPTLTGIEGPTLGETLRAMRDDERY